MCTHPFLLGVGGGVNLQPNFQPRGGGLAGPQLLERCCWERGGDFIQRGLQFLHKNKSKSEIFNGKKRLWAKKYFSIITKNSNWKISTKNLVIFKDKIVLRMKNFDTFGDSLKKNTFREGSRKTNIEGDCLKRGL